MFRAQVQSRLELLPQCGRLFPLPCWCTLDGYSPPENKTFKHRIRVRSKRLCFIVDFAVLSGVLLLLQEVVLCGGRELHRGRRIPLRGRPRDCLHRDCDGRRPLLQPLRRDGEIDASSHGGRAKEENRIW